VGATSAQVVDLTGIWQRGPSLAAGWDDRYHFYPSGSFHFYPNEMVCVEEKTERIGTWVVEGSLLTLKTTKQAIVHFEAIGSTALCRASGREEVALEEPLVEQYTLVDRGTAEGEPYPSVSIGGVTYWKFSDDASSYGDDEYPE